MTPHTPSARAVSRPLGLALAAAALAVGAAACSQADPTQDTAGQGTEQSAGQDTGRDTVQDTEQTVFGTAPTPGPGATPGCEVLAGPVADLVETITATAPMGRGGETPDDDDDDNDGVAAASENVRRLAAGVDDNALSAVASRLSGLAVQPKVDDDVVLAQWAQFRVLCDLDGGPLASGPQGTDTN